MADRGAQDTKSGAHPCHVSTVSTQFKQIPQWPTGGSHLPTATTHYQDATIDALDISSVLGSLSLLANSYKAVDPVLAPWKFVR